MNQRIRVVAATITLAVSTAGLAKWFKPGSDASLYESLNPIIRQLNTNYIEKLPEYILAQAFNKNLYYLRLMQEMAVLLKAYREESGNLLISDAQNLLKGITGEDDDNPAFIWEKTGSRYRHFCGTKNST